MKPYTRPGTCILLILLLAACSTGFAQFVSVPTTMSTPRGNITVPTMVYMPQYYNNNPKYQSKKHKYTIVLLNDSSFERKATISIDGHVHTLEWMQNDLKTFVKPTDTKEIYRMDDGIRIVGRPFDSCWLFAVDTGRINTYSITSETDYPLIAYIQKGADGPILPLTQENLEAMVADNENALDRVKKGKLFKAISLYNARENND